MTRFRLILITALGALAVPLVAASAAQADVYSCAFTGATGNISANGAGDLGVESILRDVGDGDLLDEDNGAAVDGSYTFSTANPGPTGQPGVTACMYVDNEQPTDSGLKTGHISSAGTYDNVVCGTGVARDDGPSNTTVNLGEPAGSNITATNYSIQFRAGMGVLDITSATNAEGESGPSPNLPAEGFVNIVPTESAPAGTEPCINGDVTEFQASGAFAAGTL